MHTTARQRMLTTPRLTPIAVSWRRVTSARCPAAI
jgi:hypothetical protein